MQATPPRRPPPSYSPLSPSDNAAADLLAYRISHTPADRPAVKDRLVAYSASQPGNRGRLFAECDKLVAQADTFQKSMVITAVSDGMTSQRRQECLTFLYAAALNKTLDQATVASNAARERDPADLIQALMADSVTALAFAYGLGIVAEVHTTYFTTLGVAAAKAWKAGTVAGKAKSLGLALGLGGVTTLATGVAVGLVFVATAVVKQNDLARRRAYSTEMGRDLAFVELVTGRRYRSQAQNFAPSPTPQSWTRFPEGHGGR